MNYQFETLLTTRNNVLNAIEGIALEKLNTIPKGYNNNILWNLAHMIVTQQLLCYKLSGLPMALPDEFVAKYSKGTMANMNTSQDEVNFIKEQLLALPKKLEDDYHAGIFKDFMTYTTSYNATLTNIDEAIQFNNIHEGLHFGYIMALKRSLG